MTLGIAFLASALAGAATAPQDAGALEDTWPSGQSGVPKADQWLAAVDLPLTRVSGSKAQHCKAKRVREWVKIKCADLPASAITQLGGNSEGVSYWIAPAGDDRIPGDGEFVFPVRRGERRVFLLWTLGPGYDGPLTVVPGVVIQQSFLAGPTEPVIILTDALHEPVPTRTNQK